MTTLQREHDGTSAKIVADSQAPTGERLISFEVTAHRFILAEINTHTALAKNSASSRAIPVEKQLERYSLDPAYPVSWPSEKPGMQGGVPLAGDDLEDAQALFFRLNFRTQVALRAYLNKHPEPERRLHKSVLNRLLEPMQWHTMLITSSAWQNFFDLRANPLAQPEFQVAATLMRELYHESTPVLLKPGDYHTPYVAPGFVRLEALDQGEFVGAPDLRLVSSARCARLSYGTPRERAEADEETFCKKRLIEPGHWSPFEHVATPDPDNRVEYRGHCVPKVGKFRGWWMFRHELETGLGISTYR